ncbi:MAG: response regulator transcription factor [Ruminococcaceae bacterium]|nr:response regulator transcription factor [Oscillospiraceae bacterium]
MAKILIAEDEKPINDLIKLNLELVGHECAQVFDGSTALNKAYSGKYDLVLLDVMLPEISGFEIMEELKGVSVIFVTAKSNLNDKIKGLRLGADDYIVKPFEILELVERVKAVLRRTHKDSESFSFDGVEINFISKRVFKNGTEIILKPKEYALLEALVNNRNIALSREKILDLVWNFDYEGDTRTVDVHIQRLRQKLGIEDKLKTVYKTGYRLEI